MPAKNIVAGQRVTRAKLERARQLRQNMTAAEKQLWEALRRHGLGVHFRRQQIIAGFIVDFYCHSASLVIEVDGPIHLRQLQQDARRTQAMRELGLQVLHFNNDEVLGNVPRVIARIRESLPH